MALPTLALLCPLLVGETYKLFIESFLFGAYPLWLARRPADPGDVTDPARLPPLKEFPAKLPPVEFGDWYKLFIESF